MSDLTYQAREATEEISIEGNWRIGNRKGVIHFRVSATFAGLGSFGSFSGQWWNGEGLGAAGGTWGGIRKDKVFAFFRVRNATKTTLNLSLQWRPTSPLNNIQLSAGCEEVFATLNGNDIATAKFTFDAVHLQATIPINPPFELAFARASGPKWRTLSSHNFRKMSYVEFYPEGFDGAEFRVITRFDDGTTE